MTSRLLVRDRRAAAVSLLLAAGTLACAASRPPANRPAGNPPEEIRSAAGLIAKWHVDPVEAGELVRIAVLAIEAEAGAAARGEGAASDDLAAALNAAVARLRAARPELDDDRVVGLAVQAMAASLDDGSHFIEPAQWRRIFAHAAHPAERPGGFGLVVVAGVPFPTVLRVLPGTPAAAAGLEPGSELQSVDGSTTSGLALDEVVELLQGPVGSEARLTIGARGGASRDLRLRRAAIDVGQVDCRVLGGRILYLGLQALGGRTAERVRGFAAAPGEPARWVILDLRGNTGGLLDAATSLADAFLESGPILSVEDPRGSETYRAKPGTSPLERARLAILVDERTGSGAEAVAAAMQDNGRGTVIGNRTAAVASIQQVYEIAGGALRLTVAHLVRASGERIDGRGVDPDVLVDLRAPPPATPLADVACPAFASPAPVSRDPAVARAASVLLAN